MIRTKESELIQSLYGALTDPKGFHDFLEKLTVAANGCAAQLLIIHKSPLRIDHLWYHGLSSEFLDWYQENNMIAQDVVTQEAVKQSPGLFQSALPLLPHFQPDEDYSKWENDQDMLDSAWLVIENTPTHVYLLSIQRTVAQGEYKQEELDALNYLAPYIRQTMSLYQQIEIRNAGATSLSAVIDILPEATFVLDSQGNIAYANKSANNLISNEHCIGIKNDRFVFSEKDIQKTFGYTSSLVVRSSMGADEYCSETLFLKRKHRSPLIFSIRPIESSDLLAGGALVTVYQPEKRSLPLADEIAVYFEITPAEARVCEYLIRGDDVQTIADKLNRKVATIRSQIKQIFIKTGCTKQGELISRVLASLLR